MCTITIVIVTMVTIVNKENINKRNKTNRNMNRTEFIESSPMLCDPSKHWFR